MKHKSVALLLVGGLIGVGIVASVSVASGTTRSRNRPLAGTKMRDHRVAPRGKSTTDASGSIKVKGFKHTPAQAAAARAAEARAYIRRFGRNQPDPSLVEKFRLMREAHAAGGTAITSSEITVAAAIQPLEALGATYGANPSRAGETTVGPASDDVWLVPGTYGACLVDVEGPQGAGSNCNSTRAVDAGGLWTLDTIPYGTGGAMTKVLLGAAPDGNTSVTISWTDGGTTVVPVINNVYSVPISSHTGWNSVTLTNSAGTVVTARGMRIP